MDRRHFLTAGGLAALGLTASDFPRAKPPKRPAPAPKRLAVLTSVYRYLSHSYHLARRFHCGYLKDGKHHFPQFGLTSLYVEQAKDGDLSRPLAQEGVRLSESIEDALTLGTGKLAVDGVMLIAEHGEFPVNDRLQILYPRYEYFQKVLEVFRASGRVVPVFVDKHLSYDRKKATAMVAAARQLGVPMLAGSSLPVTWREPEVELPRESPIREALVAGYGGIEVYGCHVLESLQCMTERRVGGETGVASVRCLVGEAVWKAADAGLWSWELLEACLSRSPSRNVGDIRANCALHSASPLRERGPVAFVVEYKDGLRATALLLNGHVADITFAAKLANRAEPVSTLLTLPPPPGAGFLEALAIKVEQLLDTGKSPIPVERTLLTSVMLDCGLESKQKGGEPVRAAELAVKYTPPADSGFLRGTYRR